MTNTDTADRAALPEAALACQRHTADEDIEVWLGYEAMHPLTWLPMAALASNDGAQRRVEI